MKTNFQMLHEFQDYCPKDSFITSEEEVKRITDHFCLKERNGLDLQNLRDMVVMWYGHGMDQERTANGCTEKFDHYMRAMQSIVAVIDNCKFQIGLTL